MIKSIILEQGFEIHSDPDSRWYISVDGKRRDLVNTEDFFSVWSLLERPFLEVKSELEELMLSSGSSTPFPMWKVVATAFDSRSENWTERAMSWVPYFSIDEKNNLKNYLLIVQNAKWASQKSRQIAHRVIRELE